MDGDNVDDAVQTELLEDHELSKIVKEHVMHKDCEGKPGSRCKDNNYAYFMQFPTLVLNKTKWQHHSGYSQNYQPDCPDVEDKPFSNTCVVA